MTSCSANSAVAWPGNMACRGHASRNCAGKCLRTGTASATPRLRTSAQLVGWRQSVRKKPLPISADMSICVCSASAPEANLQPVAQKVLGWYFCTKKKKKKKRKYQPPVERGGTRHGKDFIDRRRRRFDPVSPA